MIRKYELKPKRPVVGSALHDSIAKGSACWVRHFNKKFIMPRQKKALRWLTKKAVTTVLNFSFVTTGNKFPISLASVNQFTVTHGAMAPIQDIESIRLVYVAQVFQSFQGILVSRSQPDKMGSFKNMCYQR